MADERFPIRVGAFVGALGDAVWVDLKVPQSLVVGPGGVTLTFPRIAISVEDPDGFGRAIGDRC